MITGAGLNQRALSVFQQAISDESSLRIRSKVLSCGATILDFGVEAAGGLSAGVRMASVCMSGQATIEVVPGDRMVWPGPWYKSSPNIPLRLVCCRSMQAGL